MDPMQHISLKKSLISKFFLDINRLICLLAHLRVVHPIIHLRSYDYPLGKFPQPQPVSWNVQLKFAIEPIHQLVLELLKVRLKINDLIEIEHKAKLNPALTIHVRAEENVADVAISVSE